MPTLPPDALDPSSSCAEASLPPRGSSTACSLGSAGPVPERGTAALASPAVLPLAATALVWADGRDLLCSADAPLDSPDMMGFQAVLDSTSFIEAMTM